MSFTTTHTGVGLGNIAQAYPQTEYVRNDGIKFHVETVENGYILRYAHAEGMYAKTYICKTPQELSDQILASMVINKMEKS